MRWPTGLIVMAFGAPAHAQERDILRLIEALQQEAEGHRAYLESLYSISLAVLGGIIVVFVGALGFFGWKTLKDVQASVRGIVETEGREQLTRQSAALDARANALFADMEADVRSRIKSLEQAILRQQAASDVLFKTAQPERRLVKDRADKRKSVLWVDDNPSNNETIAALLANLGVQVDLAMNTEEALQALAATTYDLVISDMGRVEGRDAGLDLLQRMRARGDRTPFVIYASQSAVARTREKALELRALDAVSGPTALMGRIKPLLFPEPS